jgi:hypothetical protein
MPDVQRCEVGPCSYVASYNQTMVVFVVGLYTLLDKFRDGNGSGLGRVEQLPARQ